MLVAGVVLYTEWYSLVETYRDKVGIPVGT